MKEDSKTAELVDVTNTMYLHQNSPLRTLNELKKCRARLHDKSSNSSKENDPAR